MAKATGMMEGIEKFDGVIFKAIIQAQITLKVFEHTFSGARITSVKVNGR